MKESPYRNARKNVPTFIKFFLFLTFILLLAWSIVLVREKILTNANDLGMSLAQSYANEEENRINVYSMLLTSMSISLENGITQELTTDELQKEMADYSAQLENMMSAYIIDPYAVIDGTIIAAVPWEGDDDYSYVSSEWYQRAIAAGDDVIYTDPYTDAITGNKVVTLAKCINENNDVLAFDIFLDNFHIQKNKAYLPEAGTYLLFDSDDEIMYVSGYQAASSEKQQKYYNMLTSYIRQGKLESHNATIKGLDGQSRVVYYSELSNGWLSVITIPIDVILQDGWDRAILILSVICAVLVIVALFIMIRGYFSERKTRQLYETLQILGDSYYAIYRVNFRTNTYVSIKTTDDVKESLGVSGSYQHLLDVLKSVVDKDTHDKFESDLSTESIRKFIDDGIYDFGGDYKRNFNGTYKWVKIQVLYNQALHIDEVILAFREIDNSKRKEIQQYILLENALDAAKKTVQQKTQFFSNASHDMRTPLNAIIGLSKLSQKPDISRERVNNYMRKIQHSGEQLLLLVNDILDVSRLEHGKGNFMNYSSMDICKCVKDNVATFYEQASQEHKKLSESYDVRYSVVNCDSARLGQILNNLISNALKYSHEGAQIEVSLKELNHQPGHSKYQLIVRDTGIGMSKEYLERIFEPFTREATFTSNKVSGTGLGMPIVKTLVQQMSGEITIESEPGMGTTVTIILPLQNLEDNYYPKEAPKIQELSFTLENKTLLLAEDNEINMEVACECLRLAGANVLTAWNGQEAVEVFQSKREGEIDAILMDMQMPVMDGCEAAKAIRQLDRPDARTVPIIAVTANVFAEDIARTTAAGMDAHIAKPIDFKQLISILDSCIQNKAEQ